MKLQGTCPACKTTVTMTWKGRPRDPGTSVDFRIWCPECSGETGSKLSLTDAAEPPRKRDRECPK